MSSAVKAKEHTLRQVLLRRPVENGHAEDVFWIDNALARVGKRVQDEDGIVWLVVETYSASSFKDVDGQREAWKRWSWALGR